MLLVLGADYHKNSERKATSNKFSLVWIQILENSLPDKAQLVGIYV